jgi:4-amino-4-deoxy-L-arabinose transferase-like glycosyltransferase
MARTAQHVLWIGIIGGIVLFTNLGGPRLWDRDEPRNAGCTREMLARGDWITPVFDGELRTHKPVLLYWFMMTAYAAFGVTEFAARFWSAAAALGTAWLTYGMGRRMFSPAVGLWSAAILVTTLMFDVAARAATPDSLLLFWSTAAMAVYVWGTFLPSRERLGESAGAQVRDFPHWPVAVAMYACMGIAVLAKGPIGVLLPTAVIGMHLLIQRLPARLPSECGNRAPLWVERARGLLRPFVPGHFARTCWSMRLPTAAVVVLVVALPWYWAVAQRTEGAWIRGFFLEHNLGRAAQSLEGHRGSFLYYPVALLVGFFPWSVFAVPTILEAVDRLRRRVAERVGLTLAICWIGVYVGLFSIARTKLPSYITPCYPAVALLVGCFVASWIDGTSRVARVWPRAAFVCLGLIGMGITIAVPVAAARYLPGEYWLACLGLIPTVAAVCGLVMLRRDARLRAASAFGIGAVVFATAIFSIGAARVDTHQTFHTFVQILRERSPEVQIGTLGVSEPSWVFYTGRPLDRLYAPPSLPSKLPDVGSEALSGGPMDASSGGPMDRVMPGVRPTQDWRTKPARDVWRYLSASPSRYAITSEQYLRSIGRLPDGVRILARTPYFLQDDTLVLLGTGPSLAQTPPRPPNENAPQKSWHR